MSAATTRPHQERRRGEIVQGDALEELRRLPTATIDTVVTSPPYFRLRDYGRQGQLGLESRVEDWSGELRAVMHQIGRVLVPSGTVWLNLGDSYSVRPSEGAPRKSLLAAPERVLLGLIEDGWIVRNKLIWAKPNPIPTSVTDRLACTYEVIYLLSRHTSYHFDLDAIRLPHRSRPKPRGGVKRPPTRRDGRPPWLGPNADGDGGLDALHARGLAGHPLGKNPGDVWSIATSRYRGAHFATYPVTLIERILRAGCPERRCRRCRTPWRRPVRRLGATATRLALRPTCACQAESEPGLVLDPFMGAGTTALAAERVGRDWLGIELNPEYIEQAMQRITAARSG